MKGTFNWKIFILLLVMSLLSVAAVFPYVVTIQSQTFAKIGIPVLVVFLLQLIQCSVLFSITIAIGLVLSKNVGFTLPILDAVTKGKAYRNNLKKVVSMSLPVGAIVAFSIYLVDKLFSAMGSPISTSDNFAPIWQKLLAAFYGGITEEILMRLFLLSLLVWIAKKIFHTTEPTKFVIIISIILAAIIFGLGHLPITESLTIITPLIIIRAVVLNGIGGVVFGVLFWKKGLESAMLAHFTTDIFLLTLLPLILK